MDTKQLKNIVEAALLAAGGPLSIEQIRALFGDRKDPERQDIKAAIDELTADYEDRVMEVVEVASGYRIQIRGSMAQWLTKLWEERPPRYSRALMETLSIVAYRQPVTRGDIEDIRGVAVTTNIIRTLLERNWIRVVGHRDVPGKPSMFGTTKEFLDYFGLKKLDDLPTLAELQDSDQFRVQMDLEGVPTMIEESSAMPQAEEGTDVADQPDDGSDPELEPVAVPVTLVRAVGADEEHEPATVASLDEARAAAANDGADAEREMSSVPATVVPLKNP